ncbi:hypothetical protein AXB88_22585 [Salmonella enterica]|nr:hypothetical protein [Salmonella enterica]EDS4242506.1 hypothetical protein [Salmonella enterica subsp. enterica]HEC9488202.1 hypothetical protein [Salmonella enterica subsp. enterica serovar Orientalis]EAX1287146.1 hypothetical protein [Salmonella enterica]EAX2835576.1 hypothetical protein [Salmonella enterica]
MKKFILLSVLSSALFAGYSFAGEMHTKNEKTMAKCAKLLPQNGKQYAVDIRSVVDKDRMFTGVLTITDGSKKELSDKEKAEVKSYSDCVNKLIK